MKNKLNLPDDLEKYARKSKLKPVLIFVFSEIAVFVIFILTKDVMLAYETSQIEKFNIVGAIFYAALFIAPLFISGIIKALNDKTYIGTVEKARVSTTQDYQRAFKPTIDTGYKRNTIYLYVRDQNGDVEKRKVYSTRSMDNQELDYFKAGDKVFHIYGSKYTVIIPKPSDTIVQCAVCGITTDIKEEYCHKCGYTLPSFFSQK